MTLVHWMASVTKTSQKQPSIIVDSWQLKVWTSSGGNGGAGGEFNVTGCGFKATTGNDCIAGLGTTNLYFLCWTERQLRKMTSRVEPAVTLQDKSDSSDIVTDRVRWPLVNTTLAFCPDTCHVPTITQHVSLSWQAAKVIFFSSRRSMHRSGGLMCDPMTSGRPRFLTTRNPFQTQGLCCDASSRTPKQQQPNVDFRKSCDVIIMY